MIFFCPRILEFCFCTYIRLGEMKLVCTVFRERCLAVSRYLRGGLASRKRQATNSAIARVAEVTPHRAAPTLYISVLFFVSEGLLKRGGNACLGKSFNKSHREGNWHRPRGGGVGIEECSRCACVCV